MTWDPLEPSADEARTALREELARPEYRDTNILQRVIDAIGRLLDNVFGAASSWSSLQTFAALVVVLLIGGAVVFLVTRTRRNRAADQAPGAVLTEERASAAEMRARAEAALESGHPDEALIDGFRALTLRQVERGRLDDLPGATAHEVAVSLEQRFPDHRQRVGASASAFDAVMYGGRQATDSQARDVLGLDDELAGVR